MEQREEREGGREGGREDKRVILVDLNAIIREVVSQSGSPAHEEVFFR